MSKDGVDYGMPLTGIRVLALEHIRMGPSGSKMLAEAGAEVIKIEPPGKGALERRMVMDTGGATGVSYLITSLSHNKKSVTLDLKTERGKELFKQLVKVSDVVWENMKPDAMDCLGLGYKDLKEINPRLVYVGLSGFGHKDIYDGPYQERLAVEPIIQAMSGLMFTAGKEGDPPLVNATYLSDTVSGMVGAYGAMLALYMRQRTGLGQFVDISMYDVMVAVNNYAVSVRFRTGSNPPRGEQFLRGANGVFKAKDGPVVISVPAGSEEQWSSFWHAIEREDLIENPDLRNPLERHRNTESITRPAIAAWAAEKTVDEIVGLLTARGVPVSPVQDARDILKCPHLRARKMLIEVQDPVMGKVTEVGNPVKLSGVRELPPGVPPRLGQHNEEIFGGLLGLTTSELEELKGSGVT